MGEEKIRTKLNGVFRDVFDDELLTVDDKTTASDVEGWDSLAHVNLIVAVERAFEVSFTTKEIGGLGNVGDIVGLIETKTS
jgi:acyl carrier protein